MASADDLSPSPEPSMARRRRKKIAVVLLAVAVIGAGWLTWDFVIRPRTIREVLEGGPYRPGTEVRLAGTITQIHEQETSYGRLVSLGLDDDPTCRESGAVLGDPSLSYAIGDRFETVLHFTSYRLNGDSAVWAPELVCWFPSLLTSIGVVLDAVSFVGGVLLSYNGADPNGWAMYQIVTPWALPIRGDVLPVTLRKSIPLPPNLSDFPQGTIDSGARWTTFGGLQYLLASGMFWNCPIVDYMASLASPGSRNGTLRYVDANGNGLVDDGDRLDVRLLPTTGENAYDTYLLQIGEADGKRAAYLYSGHFILNGPRGPAETLPISGKDPHAVLWHAGDQVGGRVTTTLEVHRVTSGSSPSISEVGWSLAVNSTFASGNLTDLPSTLFDGITLSFDDRGMAGRLDAGDRFLVGNLPNRSSISFGLVWHPYGSQIAGVDWIAGYGPTVRVQWPEVTLTPTGSGPYRVDVKVSFWHPEFELTQSIRASLWERSVPMLTGVALVNGTVGTFPNGTLSFTDADGDGSVSSGDYFALQGSAPAPYQLEISIYFGTRIQVVFFGP